MTNTNKDFTPDFGHNNSHSSNITKPPVPLTAEEQQLAHQKLQLLYEQLKQSDVENQAKVKFFSLFTTEASSSKNLAQSADKLLQDPNLKLTLEDIKTLFDQATSTLSTGELRRFKYLFQNEKIKPIYDFKQDDAMVQIVFQAHCLSGTVDTIKFLLNHTNVKNNTERFYRSVIFSLQMGRSETAQYLLQHAQLDFKRPELKDALTRISVSKPELQIVAQKCLLLQNVLAPNLIKKNESFKNKI